MATFFGIAFWSGFVRCVLRGCVLGQGFGGYVLRGSVLGQGFGGYVFRDYISDPFSGRTDCAEHRTRRNTSETVFGSSFFPKNGFKIYF